MSKKKNLGQFFTVNEKVQEYMTDLMTPPKDFLKDDSTWNLLEPSAGSCELLQAAIQCYPHINALGWELDQDVVPPSFVDKGIVKIGDFFAFADEYEKNNKKFHTIFGNPPYVAWKDVENSTKTTSCFVKNNYSDKTNLYHLFMDRCIDLLEPNGEMILIVPKEWTYTTSASVLRKKFFDNGRITHIIDGGEEKVFPDADVPALIIFRYQKNEDTKDQQTPDSYELQWRSGILQNVSTWEKRTLQTTKTGLWIISNKNVSKAIDNIGKTTIGDKFNAKVGIVSGADPVFNVDENSLLQNFIHEGSVKPYVTTKGVQQFIDVNDIDAEDLLGKYTLDYLLPHKERLLERGIKKFTANDWWKYGAIRNKDLMDSETKRIYAYAKTRNIKPFFVNNDAKRFSGGLMALFVKENNNSTSEFIDASLEYLNSSLFRSLCESLGITTSNKVSFQPTTLEALPFPEDVEKFVKSKVFKNFSC